MKGFHVDCLQIHRFPSQAELAMAAAEAVTAEIRSLISERKRAIGIFASDPSSSEFLDELVNTTEIEDSEWTRVIVFQLAEYLDLGEEAPQSCRRYLLDRLIKRVPIAEFHHIRGEAANPETVCANYSALLRSRPPDFAVLGIGENGRLGLLSPGVCDFNDEAAVRLVELAEDFRRFKVREGAFNMIEEVPQLAISLTIPALMDCRRLFAIAQGDSSRIIDAEISPACPASILRKHRGAHLFIIDS